MEIPIATEILFTSEHAFRRPLPSAEFTHESLSKTDVGQAYVDMFCGFQLVHWGAFCTEASRYLVGPGNRTLSDECKSPDKIPFPRPKNEAGILANIHHCFVTPLNQMLAELSEGETHIFQPMDEKTCYLGKPGLKPDIVFAPKDIPDAPQRPLVVMEVNTPTVDVGVGLNRLRASLRCLQRGHASSSIPECTLYAFLQVFSYCVHAKTCFALLTSYDESRFAHIVPSKKMILVSDIVRHNQIWDHCSKRCHIYQAALYLVHLARITPEDPHWEKMMDVLYGDPLYEEGEKLGREGEKRPRKESDGGFRRTTRSMTERERTRSQVEKGGPSSKSERNSNYGGVVKSSSFNIYRILRRANEIPLGFGLTGSVLESKADDGKPVVVKSADFKERKCLEHVENEIKMYQQYLVSLQGRIIPKMVGYCDERYLTTGSLMVVTEKVGSGVFRVKNRKRGKDLKGREGGFCVDESLLDDTNMNRLVKLSLHGLQEIHHQNILHGDIRCANLRAELFEGKIHRVWWLDFGLSEYCVSERRKKMEEQELLEMFDRPVIPLSPI